jgi:hypothetical protein
MSHTASFRDLEQKTYLAYQRDGLLDLIIGAGILFMGLNEAMDTIIWSFLTLMLIIAYLPLKRQITFARIGYVKFKVVRQGLNMIVIGAVVMTVLVLLLVGTLFLLRSDSSQSLNLVRWIRKGPLLLYALLGFIGFGLAGLITGIWRLFIYALLSLVIMSGAHLLNLPIFVTFLFFGAAILVTGTVLLVSFLRKYPVVEEDHDVP